MVEPQPRGENPFDTTGVQRDERGAARYDNLPQSVVSMLRATVDAHGEVEALVEVNGPRYTYAQWHCQVE